MHLDYEDQIYGKMIKKKNEVVTNTKITINGITKYNKSLYDSAEELFFKILKAREEYQNKCIIASTGGAILSAFAGWAAATTVGTTVAATEAAIAAATAATIALPIIFGIGGAFAFYKGSKIIFKSNLNKKIRNSITEFKEDIEKSKLTMKKNMEAMIREFYINELDNIEKTFLGFRKMTYLDEEKINEKKIVLIDIKNKLIKNRL